MHAKKHDIVMLGFAGARIALTLADLHREELQSRFPRHFLKLEDELQKGIRTLSELDFLQEKHSDLFCNLAENCLVVLREEEVFPALWKLAEGLDAGLDVTLRSIPISQFVIEVCEWLDVNPYVNMTALENCKCFGDRVTRTEGKETSLCNIRDYETTVYGLLIATDEPEELLAFAQANEIPSAVIGRLTDKNDRVVRNGEIIRYLTPEG